MALITINVSDEEHKEIKLKATEAGMSMKDYLLGREYRKVTKVESQSLSTFAPVKITETIKPVKTPSVAKDFKLCKHGFPTTTCKYAKAGKPCR